MSVQEVWEGKKLNKYNKSPCIGKKMNWMQQLAKVIMQICVGKKQLQSPLKNVIIKRVEKSFDPVFASLSHSPTAPYRTHI